MALATEVAAYLPQSIRREWLEDNVFLEVDAAERDRLLAMADFHRPLVRTLHAAAVPMLAGTDTPIPTLTPGFSLHSEIAALRDAGLSGFEALETATVNPGRFIRAHADAGARFGTLEPGARADIVMLEADPRADPATLRRPHGVMVRGVWHDRAELDMLLQQVAESR
jgi:imidazolonepropionase-like amidohydrolase